jgi:ATP-dependent Lhr-like helicase
VNPHDLKKQLVRTWDVFFSHHGSFTSTQIAAIPPLLAGHNVLISAATASGKTEAAIAPLLERIMAQSPNIKGLRLLIILPTRALVNDLFKRLQSPIERLQISLAVKTGEFNSFNPRSPAAILLTTPESLDSLMTRHARTLNAVQAVIIDELHLFDGTVRGDQLRVLLNRLHDIREYAYKSEHSRDDHIQYAALSATLTHAEEVATRYFSPAQIITIPYKRAIQPDFIALSSDSPGELLRYLSTFRERGWRKALVFCNTRKEVEYFAHVVLQANTLFGSAVYTHYSNLTHQRRHEIETQFIQAEAALCFASSTLELGIDIGSIDCVLLIGPPLNAASFAQRIGRGSRRSNTVSAAFFYRTPFEQKTFEALLNAEPETTLAPFRPSVAIQQIFSILRQSPNGVIRLNPLAVTFRGLMSSSDLRAVIGDLQDLGYLKGVKPQEWQVGRRLHELADQQARRRTAISLYSNIQSSHSRQVEIRNQYTGRVMANVDQQWLKRELLTLEGHLLNVEWEDDFALLVSAAKSQMDADPLQYIAPQQVTSYGLAQHLATQFGLSSDETPILFDGERWLWFHWLGDIYGRFLLEMLRPIVPVMEFAHPGLAIVLAQPQLNIPAWTNGQVRNHLSQHFRRYEPMMALGAYHALLPDEIRCKAVIEQFNIPLFIHAINVMRIFLAPSHLAAQLQDCFQ